MAEAGHRAVRLARPIVLVGLMGAGKSSVGRRLAAALDAPFVDADEAIVAAAGMAIPDIFERFGEAGFRDGERRVIERLLDGPPGVIATGGGAFIDPATRDLIAARGLSVWLRAPVGLLWERVRDKPGRPLLQTADPRGTLERLDRERRPIYATAAVVVDSARGLSHEAMAARVIAAIRRHDAGAGGTATLIPAEEGP